MARYINSYSTAADVQSAIDGGTLNKPYVAYLQDEDRIDWNSKSVDYSKKPLTFEIISGGTISWQGPTITPIEKNINNTGWSTVEMNEGNTAFTLNVNAGDVVQFRGNNNVYGGNNSNYGFKESTSTFNVYGNIMSLINSTGYTTATRLTVNYTFSYLFSNCTGLTDASELLLPATMLREGCYANMFRGCTSLTTAPALPATSLYVLDFASNCYDSMFMNCTSLTQAPELPATTLTNSCYNQMFYGCTSLTTAPALPSTTLKSACYKGMFRGCTSLTTAPALPSTTLVGSCYREMFYGCISLVNAPELPATTLADSCYEGMFRDCTSLTTAPAILPATTLAQHCYEGMFWGCTNLTTAPELPATTLAQLCYYNMFLRCTNLNYIKCLATDISARDCTTMWLSGVQTNSGTFVTPASTNWTTGGSGIPSGWTRVDA